MLENKGKHAREPEAKNDESFYIKLPENPLIGSAEAMQAEEQLLTALKVHGPRKETLKPLAIFYSRTGRQETAYRYLKQWMQFKGGDEDLAECLLMCGQLAEQVDQPRSAAAFYREGLEYKPKAQAVTYFLHNNLAFCLNQQAEYEQAMTLAKQAVEIDPKRPNAYKNLGVSLEGLGRYAEAAAQWLKAMHVDASDSRPLHLLENLLAHQMDAVKASIPDIEQKTDDCRQALAAAKTGRFADWARGLTFN